jgi:hypothetical protein
MRQFIALGRPVSPVAWVMNDATIKEFCKLTPIQGEPSKNWRAQLIKAEKEIYALQEGLAALRQQRTLG